MEITIHNPSDLATDLTADPWYIAYHYWLASFRSNRTRQAYDLAWKQFTAFVDMHPGAVGHEQVRRWQYVLQHKHQPAGVNQKLSAISSFYKFVNRNYAHLRDDNPCADVRQLKVNPYGKATLLADTQDVDLLRSIDRSDSEGVRDYAILMLFLTTGVRLAAIANAKNADIRRQGAITYFHYIGKGDKEFNKRLPANVAKAVLEWLDRKPYYDASLFGMSRRQIQHMIKRRCDAVFGKGHGIHAHSLRHTAANNAAKTGGVQDVRALLDHESTRVTAVYLDHITQEQGERLSEALDSRYEG